MNGAGKHMMFFIWLFLLSFSALFAQTATGNFYILVAEYEEGSSVNINQAIVRYDFDNGTMTRKEKLMSVATKKRGSKEDYVRMDIGTPQLYRNRYVIAGNGPIIDLQTHKVICEEKAQFVKCNGDSVIFYTNDIFKGKYYSYFDLSKNSSNKIENPSYKALPGQDVEVDQTSSPYKIVYYPAGAEKKVLVEDAGSPGVKKVRLPYYWLDNENFIYPNYAKDKQDIVTLFKVNVKKGKERIAFVKLDAVSDSAISPRFYKNAEGELIFQHAPTAKYSIDLKEKKMQWQESENIGNGFTVSLSEYRNTGRSIKYKGEEIGNYYCDFNQSKSAPGVLAIPFEITMRNERYSQGMMVWMASSKKWKNVDNPDILGIIAIIEK